MQVGLTAEAAQNVELTWRPFKRHSAVRAMLSDPEWIGDNRVKVNPRSSKPIVVVPGEGDQLIIETMLPVLGRRTLLRVAEAIRTKNNIVKERNGEDF